MSKYAVAVDHKAGSGKGWTYVRLKNTDKAMAFAEASVKGFSRDDVFCINILKKVGKGRWASIVRVYPNGAVEDVTGEYLGVWELDEKWDFED